MQQEITVIWFQMKGDNKY